MYTLGTAKRLVLQKIREYSNSGSIVSTSDNKDYLYSMNDLFNIVQLEIATTKNKIKKTYQIHQNMPDNVLGDDWLEEEVHTNADVTYEGLGSQAYSFQVAGTATVYIEQYTTSWVTLVTVTHTPTAGEGFVTYSGLTGAATTNNVRIRFSGSYRYLYRWVALYADLFDTVPAYEPYVPYDLPTTVYEINNVSWTHADKVKNDYSDYRIEEYDNYKKRIYINWTDKGEFTVSYSAYPTAFLFDADNLTLYDTSTFDVPDECMPGIIDKVASILLSDENPNMADKLTRDYYFALDNLKTTENFGNQTIINVSNW